MAETTMTNKERMKEITDGIEQGIKDLFQSDKYSQYLGTMSRFHRYSVNNQMLIYMQKPDATLVAGFNKWRDQFERHVNKGEKGIKIIAPTPFKKTMEMQKLDPDTGAQMLNPDGTVITEEKEIQIPMYKPVTVFDVSQTDGKPLPSLVADLSGNVERYELFFEAMRRASPVPIRMETMNGRMDGYFSLDRQDIALREGMSEVQTISAAVHEIAHAKLHNNEQAQLAAAASEGKEQPKPKDRNTEEVEAESISYAVCQYYGIQTGENSFGYIASWSKDKELPELRASLETINKTASSLITDIDRHYRDVVKEFDTVIEAWAADYADYVFENSGDSLIIPTRDELISGAVDDIKCGDSRFPRNALLDIELKADNSAAKLYSRLDEIEKNYPPVEHNAVFLLDGESYLHLQTAIDGYDYTHYDKSLYEIDGGVIDYPHISFEKAYEVALSLEGLQPETSENVSLDILDEISAVRQADIEQYKRENNSDQPAPDADLSQMSEVELWESDRIVDFSVSVQEVKSPITPVSRSIEVEETPPDKAPENGLIPDPAMSIEAMNAYGYTDENMLPLSQKRALELMERDFTVYLLYDDNTEAMAFEPEEIEIHDGIFGIERVDWERSAEYRDATDKMQDSFEIYQLKHGEECRDLHFENYDRLQSMGIAVDRDNYNLVYTAPLTATGSTGQKLESLYGQFNLNHPADFTGHSLSVSDIIALKQSGNVTYHYCDSVGFTPLPGFDSGKNYLRSVEDSVEQNDNNLDGIINNTPAPTIAELGSQVKAGQSISLMDLARATKREAAEKKPSVIEKLGRSAPPQERKKTVPTKGAEMEI
ncbi:MAG: YodL domain-containing protein [Oscillospiraceae bacterium]|jgi:antirestriction protein ArdC